MRWPIPFHSTSYGSQAPPHRDAALAFMLRLPHRTPHPMSDAPLHVLAVHHTWTGWPVHMSCDLAVSTDATTDGAGAGPGAKSGEHSRVVRPRCFYRCSPGFLALLRRATMFITAFTFPPSLLAGTPVDGGHFTLHELIGAGIEDEASLREFLHMLERVSGVTMDWATWTHDEHTRSGSIGCRPLVSDSAAQEGVGLVQWSYEPLDDPDRATILTDVTDHREVVVGALTFEQSERFWQCMEPPFEPLDLFDDALVGLGLTPAAHDQWDDKTMRFVIALTWYRMFPTTVDAESAIGDGAALDSFAQDAVLAMAARCALLGSQYELYGVLVESS